MINANLLSISRYIIVATLSLTCIMLNQLPIRAINVSERVSNRTYLKLIPSKGGKSNRVGNTIYRLEAYVDSKLYRIFNAVTGRASSQRKNRYRDDFDAPLPDGVYRVSKQILPGTHRELGRTFVAIYPRFRTKRKDMGIHLDPSYNKRNGKDGTSGCIGLTSQLDRDEFNQYIRKYHPYNLIVRIDR
jgi:hypothetical protein